MERVEVEGRGREGYSLFVDRRGRGYSYSYSYRWPQHQSSRPQHQTLIFIIYHLDKTTSAQIKHHRPLCLAPGAPSRCTSPPSLPAPRSPGTRVPLEKKSTTKNEEKLLFDSHLPMSRFNRSSSSSIRFFLSTLGPPAFGLLCGGTPEYPPGAFPAFFLSASSSASTDCCLHRLPPPAVPTFR